MYILYVLLTGTRSATALLSLSVLFFFAIFLSRLNRLYTVRNACRRSATSIIFWSLPRTKVRGYNLSSLRD